MTVTFKKLQPSATLPSYAHPGDAGMDVCACEGVTLQPGERRLIRTGLVMELPRGTEAQMRPRSGLALKHGVTLLNSPGTIDADYRGTVRLVVVNHGTAPVTIRRGQRLAQLVVARVERATLAVVDELPGTARGERGFGSTGR